jgi:hypothetical protein
MTQTQTITPATHLLTLLTAVPATGTALAPATRGELAAAFQGFAIVDQRRLDPDALLPPEPVTLDSELLWIYVATMVLHTPAASVTLVRQVGRFAVVQYQPVVAGDPDLLVVLGVDLALAQPFHQAVLAFQRVRQARFPLPEQWQKAVLVAARQVLGPLAALQPHPLEADFALRWLLLIAASGNQSGVWTARPARPGVWAPGG